MNTELDRAIADMEDARRSHAEWAEYFEKCVEGDECEHCKPQAKIAGDAPHNREWVEKYDRVLRLLKEEHVSHCRYHRCAEHAAVPQLNASEFSGAECGACVRDAYGQDAGAGSVRRAA